MIANDPSCCVAVPVTAPLGHRRWQDSATPEANLSLIRSARPLGLHALAKEEKPMRWPARTAPMFAVLFLAEERN